MPADDRPIPTTPSPIRDYAHLEELARLAQLMERRRRLIPAEWYEPHSICERSPIAPELQIYDRKGRPSGQLQFHESQHPIRVMAPGNGWGGTTAMGAEVDSWMRHTNRWQQTPEWPIRACWFCPQYKQFDFVRRNLEEVAIGSLPRFKDDRIGPRYEWPDGGVMYLYSYDRSWESIQGIELDLACFDEQPPLALWREMIRRRRGRRKTRYICKATQTKGRSWMAEDIYEPWLSFHAGLGMTEEEAMVAQNHDLIWCWPKGGYHDNPAVDDEDIAFQERQPASSETERKVRLFGGFDSFVGDPVFNESGIRAMLARLPELEETYGVGRDGSFVVEP